MSDLQLKCRTLAYFFNLFVKYFIGRQAFHLMKEEEKEHFPTEFSSRVANQMDSLQDRHHYGVVSASQSDIICPGVYFKMFLLEWTIQ